MLLFVGLFDDPGNELFGLLPGLGKQLERNHIKHLYGLIQLHIHLPQIHHPEHQKCQSSQYNINIQNNRTQINNILNITLHNTFPRLKYFN